MKKVRNFREFSMKSLSISFFALFSFFLVSACAPQAASPKLENEIDILESRVIALEQQKLKTVADLRQEVEDFKSKSRSELESFRRSQQFFIEELNKLRQDLEFITNDTEKTQHDIRKLTARVRTMNKRLGDQVIALQELKKFFDAGINAEAVEEPGKQQEEFLSAVKLFKERQFRKAEEAFLAYKEKYPKSDLIDDAVYYVAYMYFLRGDYGKASLKFFELMKLYPKSNWLNDAKWWLGVSLERSGDLNGALDLYRELVKLPDSNPLKIKAEFRLEELAPSE